MQAKPSDPNFDEAVNTAVAVLQGSPVDPTLALEEIYNDLRGLARAKMSRERPGHTLRPTALVNEVYMVVAKKYGDQFWLQDRAQVLATFSAAMRNFLWDYYKTKTRQKRSGSASRVESEVLDRLGVPAEVEQLIVSDVTERGLKALRDASPRQYQVVEFRLSLCLKEDEIANLMGVHVNTVKNDWREAKAFLKHYFTQEGVEGKPEEVATMLTALQSFFAAPE